MDPKIQIPLIIAAVVCVLCIISSIVIVLNKRWFAQVKKLFGQSLQDQANCFTTDDEETLLKIIDESGTCPVKPTGSPGTRPGTTVTPPTGGSPGTTVTPPTGGSPGTTTTPQPAGSPTGSPGTTTTPQPAGSPTGSPGTTTTPQPTGSPTGSPGTTTTPEPAGSPTGSPGTTTTPQPAGSPGTTTTPEPTGSPGTTTTPEPAGSPTGSPGTTTTPEPAGSPTGSPGTTINYYQYIQGKRYGNNNNIIEFLENGQIKINDNVIDDRYTIVNDILEFYTDSRIFLKINSRINPDGSLTTEPAGFTQLTLITSGPTIPNPTYINLKDTNNCLIIAEEDGVDILKIMTCRGPTFVTRPRHGWTFDNNQFKSKLNNLLLKTTPPLFGTSSGTSSNDQFEVTPTGKIKKFGADQCIGLSGTNALFGPCEGAAEWEFKPEGAYP